VLPASPLEATSSCAAATEQDLVDICTQGAETVRITKVTFEALWPAGTCNDELYGINVGGNAKLVLTNSVMDGAGAHPVNGCQGGVGIQIGRQRTSQVATATLTDDSVSEYQKNGITVDNTGSKATMKRVTVTGAGPTDTAQNGIQVSRGATGKIGESTITDNECNAAEVAACGNGSAGELEEDATGVLFYLEGKGSYVMKSRINNNDLGVSHLAGEETTRPQVTINDNELIEDRYASVMLGQGNAMVSKDTMRKGTVGVLLLQYAGQAFGPKGSGSEDEISEMTSFAIEGLSDNEPSDQFGSFTVTKSEISGNPPGADVEEAVHTNNPSKLRIITNATDS
jgi:parallel beta helix pectate lyase-like protein